MSEELIINLFRELFTTTFFILIPILGTSLIIGITISIFQAATSIQEMTLTFVPKIIITAIVIIILFPWIIDKITSFTIRIFDLFIVAVK